MLTESELKEAERKNYLSYFEDGIADTAAGLPVLSFGLAMVFDATLLFTFTWMPALLYLPLKQLITLPRMGYVKFNPERRRKISKSMVLMLSAGIAFLVLGVLAAGAFNGQIFNLEAFMRKYSPLVLGVVMASAFALIGALFELRRFLIYAALVLAAWAIPFLVPIREGLPVATAGALISLFGIGLLTRFLKRYPKPAE